MKFSVLVTCLLFLVTQGLGQEDDDPYANNNNVDYDVGSFDAELIQKTKKSQYSAAVAPRPRVSLQDFAAYITQLRQPVRTGPPGGSGSSLYMPAFLPPVAYVVPAIDNKVDGKLVVDGKDCERDCGKEARACRFQFTLSAQEICSDSCSLFKDQAGCEENCIPGDGVGRGVIAVNNMIPGPSIRVCEGDMVIVNVTNYLNESTAIHWHGIHQKETPWYDGVPNLTQCGILPLQSFEYAFQVPIGGTYFWHSHHGVQRGDGIYGALIVRKRSEKEAHGPLNAALYDFDLPAHEMIVMDWQFRSLEDVLHGTLNKGQAFHPVNLLVNGRGLPLNYFNETQPIKLIRPELSIQEFRIQPKKAYRFRIISNAITSCPIEISVENHEMMVIASDGFEVAAQTVDSLVIYAGERFDVVIKGNQPIGSYWMKFRGLNYCNTPGYPSVYQVAVLNYVHDTVPRGSVPHHFIRTWREARPRRGRQLNPLNFGPGVRGYNQTVAELNNIYDPEPEILSQEKPDYKFYLSYDFNRVDNIKKPTNHQPGAVVNQRNGRKYTPQINLVTHIPPKTPPLTQPETMESMYICDNLNDTFVDNTVEGKEGRHLFKGQHGGKNCTAEFCACTHILQVKLDSIVEIILIDNGQILEANHPFHLHGHSFRVVGMERLDRNTTLEEIKELDNLKQLNRRRTNAPIKDTVTVPDGGYTIIRFKADNPGFWFFHCHIEFHVEVGMGLIIQVGDQVQDMKKPPKNFPKCKAEPTPKPTTPTPTTEPTSTSTTTRRPTSSSSTTSSTTTSTTTTTEEDTSVEETAMTTFRNPIERNMKNPASIHLDKLNSYYYWACSMDHQIKVRRSKRLTHWGRSAFTTVYTDPDPDEQIFDPKIFSMDDTTFYMYFQILGFEEKFNLFVIQGKTSYADGKYGERIRLEPKGGDFDGKTPTAMSVNGKLYLVWSGLTDSRTQSQFGIYMAEMSSPTKVSGTPVLVYEPRSAWEGVAFASSINLDSGEETTKKTGVVEYPDITRIGDTTYLIFAANDRLSDEYCLGAAILNNSRLNPLEPKNWERVDKCVFEQNPAQGVYSVGAFSVTMSPDLKEMWVIYEAKSEKGTRSRTEKSVRAQRLDDQDNIFYFPTAMGLGVSLPLPSGQRPTKYFS